MTSRKEIVDTLERIKDSMDMDFLNGGTLAFLDLFKLSLSFLLPSVGNRLSKFKSLVPPNYWLKSSILTMSSMVVALWDLSKLLV